MATHTWVIWEEKKKEQDYHGSQFSGSSGRGPCVWTGHTEVLTSRGLCSRVAMGCSPANNSFSYTFALCNFLYVLLYNKVKHRPRAQCQLKYLQLQILHATAVVVTLGDSICIQLNPKLVHTVKRVSIRQKLKPELFLGLKRESAREHRRALGITSPPGERSLASSPARSPSLFPWLPPCSHEQYFSLTPELTFKTKTLPVSGVLPSCAMSE